MFIERGMHKLRTAARGALFTAQSAFMSSAAAAKGDGASASKFGDMFARLRVLRVEEMAKEGSFRDAESLWTPNGAVIMLVRRVG